MAKRLQATKKKKPKPAEPQPAQLSEPPEAPKYERKLEQPQMSDVLPSDYEKLQVMKAKTMYEMVEDIDLGNGHLKLLFLTNSQADSISSSQQTLRKMLEALEIRTPKLVINLMSSWGLRNSLNLFPANKYNLRMNPGVFHNSPPFLTADDEQESMEKLDMFMSDVILPLAASTHALILANAIPGDCALANALSRAYRLQRTKWGNPPPFSILSIAGSTPRLYLNPNEGAHWHALRRKSKAWSARHETILETIQTHGYFRARLGEATCTHDLDPESRYIVLIDSVKSNGQGFTTNPSQALRTELVRLLASTLPSFVMKTGHAEKFANDEKTFQACLDQANAGMELLFLDLRKRPHIPVESTAATAFVCPAKKLQETFKKFRRNSVSGTAVTPGVTVTSRSDYIEAAWAHFTQTCDDLRAMQICDSLDACSLAYAHRFLYGSMTSKATERSGNPQRGASIPLHEAIRLGKEERWNHQVSLATTDTDVEPASDAQVVEIAQRLAKRIYEDCFHLLPVPEQHEENRAYYFNTKAPQLTSSIRALLLNPKLRAVNIHDLDEARRMVNQMVQSDRLPQKNSLEGLLLLQQAWDECDIAHHLARHYKFYTKALYLIQLVLAWLVIVSSQVEDSWFESIQASFADVAFVLTVLSGAAVSIEGILKPKPKWQALRCGNMTLESIIWRYRARVGPFRLAPNIDPRQPELMLCKQLNDWVESLMSSADLKRSVWSKKFRPSVYKHKQHSGCFYQDARGGQDHIGLDDHYSPVQPDLYIQCRTLQTKDFYQKRIPRYSIHALVFKLGILACTIACSILARFNLAIAVVTITALASAATTWAEFVDAGTKVERYTSAVRSITHLLNWWKNLSEVEKASTENISYLILETEQTIADEQASWMSSRFKSEQPKEAQANENTTPSDPAKVKTI